MKLTREKRNFLRLVVLAKLKEKISRATRCQVQMKTRDVAYFAVREHLHAEMTCVRSFSTVRMRGLKT